MEEQKESGYIYIPLTQKPKDERNTKIISPYGSRRNKILYTLFIYLVYIFHGMNNNLLGPSLIDLEHITNSTTSTISTVFIWKNGGYLLGTAISGPIVDRVNEFLIIGIALFLSAIATYFIPAWKQLIGLSLTTGGAGVAIAFNSVCTSATILAIWGQDAKPYQQALHFFVTIGAALTPQLLKPFLKQSTDLLMDHTNDNQTSFIRVYVNVTSLGNRITRTRKMPGLPLQSESHSGKFYDDTLESHIHYCYIIIASCLMILSLSSFILFIYNGCRIRKKIKTKGIDEVERVLITGKSRIMVLTFLFFQSFMYGGIEEVFAGLTMTFVVKHLQMTNIMAANISTLFMAMTAASRAAGTVLSKHIQPAKLLGIQIAILLIGSLILAFAVESHWFMPWLGFAAAGLGTGSLFPTLINWAHGCMMVKGKETALLFTGGAFTGMTVPPLIGFLFEKLNPMWFAYIILILVGCLLILFIINIGIVYSAMKAARRKFIQKQCFDRQRLNDVPDVNN